MAESESLFRFDLIRASKILEMSQYAILTFVFAFFMGAFIDNNFPVTETDESKITNYELIKNLGLQLILIVIASYYTRKIVGIIPLFVKLTNEYQRSLKGESQFGISIAQAIIFIGVQKNFSKRIGILHSRF